MLAIREQIEEEQKETPDFNRKTSGRNANSSDFSPGKIAGFLSPNKNGLPMEAVLRNSDWWNKIKEAF